MVLVLWQSLSYTETNARLEVVSVHAVRTGECVEWAELAFT